MTRIKVQAEEGKVTSIDVTGLRTNIALGQGSFDVGVQQQQFVKKERDRLFRSYSGLGLLFANGLQIFGDAGMGGWISTRQRWRWRSDGVKGGKYRS